MTIRCIAVDDEPLALEKIKSFIERTPLLELAAAFDNGFDAMTFLRRNRVDLLFLDIQMDELTGIQLLESLVEKPRIILTTAYDQYALKGYELNVADYLLKPISYERFLKAVEKVRRPIEAKAQRPPAGREETEAPPNYILVRSEYRLQRVNLCDILYVEGMKDYSRIYTPDARIMTLQNLKKIEEALPSPPFLRVHKSFIVSLHRIDSIARNDLQVGGQAIPIGGLYKKRFQEYIEQQKLIG